MEDALRQLAEVSEVVGVEEVALERAVGRILAQRVVADRPLPPFNRSAMDGYCLRLEDLDAQVLPVVRQLHAGDPSDLPLESGTCWRINTGAALPPRADLVVRSEDCTELEGGARVRLEPGAPKRWANVHRRGTDAAEGDVLLEPGAALGAKEIGVGAAVGAARLLVRRTIRVGILPTGSELVPVHRQPAATQIRDSNSAALAAMFDGPGLEVRPYGGVVDEPERLRAAAAELLANCDLAFLIGGVSKGTKDYVPEILAELGMKTLFHGVAIRPGKPLLAGVRDGKVVLSLPGNPNSSLITARYFGGFVLRRMWGLAPENFGLARYETVGRGPEHLHYFQLVHARSEGGELVVRPVQQRGSGDFVAMSRADGVCMLPAGVGVAEVGDRYPFLPLSF
jgi:molybdopterin molybdotransferase